MEFFGYLFFCGFTGGEQGKTEFALEDCGRGLYFARLAVRGWITMAMQWRVCMNRMGKLVS